MEEAEELLELPAEERGCLRIISSVAFSLFFYSDDSLDCSKSLKISAAVDSES